MANYQLSYTGAEIDSAVGKASKLPAQLGTAGQVLKVNSGATGTEWANESGGGGGASAYTISIENLVSRVLGVSSMPLDIEVGYHTYHSSDKLIIFLPNSYINVEVENVVEEGLTEHLVHFYNGVVSKVGNKEITKIDGGMLFVQGIKEGTEIRLTPYSTSGGSAF